MKSFRFLFLLLFAAVVVGGVFVLGVRPRLAAAEQLVARSEGANLMPVSIIVASPAAAETELVLPATLNALQEAPIYARTSGYLSSYLVDLGDPVNAGQTLATIDAPEVDQELNQARAALAQVKAHLEIDRISAERWKDMAGKRAVAQQDADEKAATYAVTQADVVAAEANVSRLTQLKQYQTITAPFDGVISARNVDLGALVTAGGSGKALFRVTQRGTLRVYINTPQAYFQAMKPGLPVEVFVTEFPGRTFRGEVTRVAGALDPAARTLQTEVQLPNESGELIPGMFGQVRVKVKSPAPALIVPSTAVFMRNEGTYLAVVDDANTVHLNKVLFGRDFGTKIEVLNGVAPGSHVINNPSDVLTDGLVVNPVMPEPAAKKG